MSDAFNSLRRPVQPVEPDVRFAETLRDELRHAVLNGAEMTTPETPTHAEHHSLGAYLAVTDARAAVEFYVAVFDAQRRGEPIVMDNGSVGHAEVAIGDSVLMMAEPFPEIGHVVAPVGGAGVLVQVPDVDTAVARAHERGAEVNYPARDTGHGRQANITDPFGQRWIITQAT